MDGGGKQAISLTFHINRIECGRISMTQYHSDSYHPMQLYSAFLRGDLYF